KGHQSIVYIRSLESLTNNSLGLNLNELLSVLLSERNIRLITACSPSKFKKLLSEDSNLVKEFTTLNIDPTTPERAVEVLRGVAARYEKYHNIKIGETAINAAVKFAKRYIQDRFLPESAIDLLDEAASNKKMETTGVPA